MRARLSVLILACAAASCAFSACRSGKGITVVSWNVGVFSKYKDNSTAEVAALIKAAGADFVALNELDSCNRRHNVYQLQELSRELGGWEIHFASAFPFADGAYGNGVMARPPITVGNRYSIALPRFDGSEPRSCAVMETERCVVASVHLDHKGDTASVCQARLLNDWFVRFYAACKKPVILCGDFNSRPDSETIRTLSGHWRQLSGTDPTYPSDTPDRCIDYIFALKAAAPVKVTSARVLAGAADASDHLPVAVSFK